jgi:diguanylate cyclase (GGDEF)-like protein
MLHLVDIQLLTRALKSFSSLTGISFSLYNERENLLIAPEKEDPVISFIKSRKKGQEAYSEFFGKHLKLSMFGTKSIIAEGPTGQFHVFIPVRYKEIVLVAVGEAFYPSTERFLKFYSSQAEEFQMDDKTADEWLEEIKVIPLGEMEHVLEAVQPLMEKIAASGYESGELKKQWQWSKTIINLAANIKAGTSLDDIRQIIIDTVSFLFGAETSAIFSQKGEYFVPEAVVGRNRDVVSQLRIPRNNKLLEEAIAAKHPVAAIDSYKLWHSGFPEDIISLYLFPISSNGDLFGFLGIFNTLLDKEAFDSVNEFCKLSSYVCCARMMSDNLEKKTDGIESILSKTLMLYENYKEPEKLYQGIVNEASSLMYAEKCSLMLPQEGRDTLYVSAVKGLNKWLMEDVRVRVGEGIAGRAFEQGVPILIEGEDKLRDYAIAPKPLFKTASCLSMPLKISGETIGVLNLSDKLSSEPFTEDDVTTLSPFAAVSAMLIKLSNCFKTSERMRELSITDPLTGLFNRRYFDVRLEEEYQRAKRYGLVFSLAIIDIDDFKVFNDTEGHLAGDQVLREIALIMNNSIRANDILVRFGGEEFAIIMPQTTKEEAFHVLERIRNNMYTLMIPALRRFPGKRLTISTGIAMFPECGEPVENVIVCADRALYKAKMQGKNRTLQWMPDASRQVEKGGVKRVARPRVDKKSEGSDRPPEGKFYKNPGDENPPPGWDFRVRY